MKLARPMAVKAGHGSHPSGLIAPMATNRTRC